MIAIAGNKSDLEEKREVQASQAKAYADEIGALFIETSAKEDTNVSDLFISISTSYLSSFDSYVANAVSCR